MKNAHSLMRIKGSLTNTPHLIEQNSFNSIMEYVNSRIRGDVEIASGNVGESSSKHFQYNEDTKTGILSIEGSLTYKPTGWEPLCGGTSYVSLKEQMDYFAEQGAKTVAMVVDSGGGHAFSMIDTANYIRKVASESGIKLTALVDGMSASAAYGLTVVADEIVATPSSMVGSVGVLIQLMSDSKALEKEGYERTFVTSSAGKIPYDDKGSFRQEFLDDLQSQVDSLYDDFSQHVADYRGLTQEAVKATDARMFMTKDALSLGLIDKVMSIDDWYNYLADYAQSNLEESDMSNPLKDMFKLNKKEDKAEMSQLTELQALLETKEAELSASLDQIATMSAHMADMKDQLESLQSFAQAQKDAAEAAQAEAARIAEEQAQAKIAQRKASLSAVLAEDKVEATFEALASLEDSAFELVVAQYAAAKEALAESFKALGGEGVELEDTTTSEQGSVNAIRQAGVESARKRFNKSK